MEAAVHSIGSELEETIKRRVEDVLLCVDQKTQGLRKELNETIEETQVALDDPRYVGEEPPGYCRRHEKRPPHRGTDN
jgi:hypothetical protein